MSPLLVFVRTNYCYHEMCSNIFDKQRERERALCDGLNARSLEKHQGHFLHSYNLQIRIPTIVSATSGCFLYIEMRTILLYSEEKQVMFSYVLHRQIIVIECCRMLELIP